MNDTLCIEFKRGIYMHQMDNDISLEISKIYFTKFRLNTFQLIVRTSFYPRLILYSKVVLWYKTKDLFIYFPYTKFTIHHIDSISFDFHGRQSENFRFSYSWKTQAISGAIYSNCFDISRQQRWLHIFHKLVFFLELS